jgi:drug/metabolite transporter (DMT)-like permease
VTPETRPGWSTLTLTTLAMIAFAANSLLCRAALASGAIDAASFTALRVVSGAALLGFLLLWPPRRRLSFSVPMALMLFVYMLGFSLAYESLTAATGALLLFGAVQLTMLGWALRSGEVFGWVRWAGMTLALGGLVYLLLPGVTAPDPTGAALMITAGMAWGIYSLLGRGSRDPLADTAGNFLLAVPLGLLAWTLVPAFGDMTVKVTGSGVLLALASGALASGLGYVLWYAALPGLGAGRAATVQLSVPVLAGLGGALLLSEPLSARLLLAGAIVLGGIALALRKGDRPRTGQ